MNHVAPLLIAIPLGTALLIPLVGRQTPRLVSVLCNVAFFVSFLLCLSLPGREFIYHMGAWPTPIGIDMRVDGLATLLLLTINGLALIVALYSVPYVERFFTSPHQYYCLLMLMITGVNGVVLTADLFNLYVFMEIATVASYALVAFGGKDEDFEASFKYAVIGGLSSTAILLGIGLVYGTTGSLNMAQVASRLSTAGTSTAAPLQFALALFVCGCAVKAALVPFHAWLPDAYPAAPAPISAVLAGVVSKVLGIYVLVRLLFNVFGITDELLMVMRWMGGITMVFGGLLALGQWDIKRLLAYSSVSQVGLILLSFGFGTTWGVVGALYHLFNHAVFKPLLFLNSGQVEITAGTRDLREMNSLGNKIPLTAATYMVGSLALAGIPPFNGFWSKLIIVLAGVRTGHLGWSMLVIVVSIMALAYQLRVQSEAFGSRADSPAKTSNADREQVREPLLMALPVILLAIGCLASSLFVLSGLEQPLLVGPAAEVLLNGVWSK